MTIKGNDVHKYNTYNNGNANNNPTNSKHNHNNNTDINTSKKNTQ